MGGRAALWPTETPYLPPYRGRTGRVRPSARGPRGPAGPAPMAAGARRCRAGGAAMTAAMAPGPRAFPLSFFGVADHDAIPASRIEGAVRQCLDPTEQVLAQRHLHWTALRRPLVQTPLVVFCACFVDVLLPVRSGGAA